MGTHGYFYKLFLKKSLTKYLIKKKPVTKSKDPWVGNVKSSHGEQVSTREKSRNERIMDLLLIWWKPNSRSAIEEFAVTWISSTSAKHWEQEQNCERPASTDNTKSSDLDYEGQRILRVLRQYTEAQQTTERVQPWHSQYVLGKINYTPQVSYWVIKLSMVRQEETYTYCREINNKFSLMYLNSRPKSKWNIKM